MSTTLHNEQAELEAILQGRNDEEDAFADFELPSPSLPAVKKLHPHHRAICRALASGLRPSEVAVRFGISSSWLSQLLRTPLVQAEIERLELQAEDKLIDAELRSLQPRAMEVIAEELYSQVPTKTRVDTAFKLLDRTGYEPKGHGAPKNDNRRFTLVNLTPMPGEDPVEALKRVQEIAGMINENERDDGDDEFD